jgi:hypothetical protein
VFEYMAVAIAGSRWRLGGWPGSQHIHNAQIGRSVRFVVVKLIRATPHCTPRLTPGPAGRAPRLTPLHPDRLGLSL